MRFVSTDLNCAGKVHAFEDQVIADPLRCATELFRVSEKLL
jgi:hypothetical protein